MKQTALAIPREITRPCPHCDGGFETFINGEFIRQERIEAHVTLSQAARACGISAAHMSRMELGGETFQRGYAEICERLFERRRRAGNE